jgi:tetratricopeptide (TPR) repeat protein
MGGMIGADNGVGLNILDLYRMRRQSGAQISGNLNRSNAASVRNRTKAANTVETGSSVNRGNVNREGTGWNNPHLRLNREWVLGYWPGRYSGGLGWRAAADQDPAFLGVGVGGGPAFGLVTGLGWGLSSWLYGPILFQSGYSPYRNAYQYTSATFDKQPVAYDYSQPIDAQSALPPKIASDRAISTFATARQSFKRGDYESALILIDHALKLMPNDPALHEFRALTLFALRRCDEAAPALYAVLSIEPGWDWATLIGLYGDPERYTQQLRAVEALSVRHPQSAPAHFVLAYHYLTQEFAAAAIEQFKLAVALEPKDSLSAQLIEQLERPQISIAANPISAGSNQIIEGAWIAQRSDDVNITVTTKTARHFSWNVSRHGESRQLHGQLTERDDLVSFIQADNSAMMIGRLSRPDQNRFVFRVLGAPSSDPGVTFTKSQQK